MASSSHGRRRVTFREERSLGGTSGGRRRCVGLTQPKGVAMKNSSNNKSHRPILKNKTPISLHGRVLVGSGQPEVEYSENFGENKSNDNERQQRQRQRQQPQHHQVYYPEHFNNLDKTKDSSNSKDHNDGIDSRHEENVVSSNIRDAMERKSVFSRLASQVEQFQKVVADLEQVSRGRNNAAAQTSSWRVRNLVTTAQSIDKRLWQDLFAYEKTLAHDDMSVAELRTAQSNCMKLHRDFKRTHRALIMCLSVFKKEAWHTVIDPQEVSSQLGSVGWMSLKSEEERAYQQQQQEQQHFQQEQQLLKQQEQQLKEEQEEIQAQQAHLQEIVAAAAAEIAKPLHHQVPSAFYDYRDPYREEQPQPQPQQDDPYYHAAADPQQPRNAPLMIITRKMAQRQSANASPPPPQQQQQHDGAYLEPVYHEPPVYHPNDDDDDDGRHYDEDYPYPDDHQQAPSIFTGLSTLSSPSGIHQRMQSLLYEQFEVAAKKRKHKSSSSMPIDDEDEEDDYDDYEDDVESMDSVASGDDYRKRDWRLFNEALWRRWKRYFSTLVLCGGHHGGGGSMRSHLDDYTVPSVHTRRSNSSRRHRSSRK